MMMQKSIRVKLLAVLGTAVMFAASPVLATVSTDGNVSPVSPTLWTSNTTAYVGNSTDGSVAVDGGSTIVSSYAYVGNGTGAHGTVTLSGGGSGWSSTGNVYTGYSGTGTLSLTGGSVFSANYLSLGTNSSGNGSLMVNGVGTSVTSYVCVGYSGTGNMTVSDGAKITGSLDIAHNSGSHGNLVVNGGSATGDIYFGGGVGSLTVSNGGTLDGNLWITGGAGSSATASVDGSGSVWTHADGIIGSFGDGSLSITNGAQLVSDSNTIGYGAGGTGSLRLDGSTWSAGSFYVGGSGTGTLTVVNGSKVTSNGLVTLGYSKGGNGTVTFDGVGASWNSGAVFVGGSGTGLLKILNGATLTQSGTSSLGDDKGASGTITLDGSTWTQNYMLYVGNSGTGTLNITNGGKLNGTSGYTNYIGNKLGSTGTMTVDGTGSAWTNGGPLYVGNSGTGTLTISHGGQVSGGMSTMTNYIGYTGKGTVTVDGAGSNLTLAGTTYIGYGSVSVLSVTGGANARIGGTVYLANNSNSKVTATIDGAGSVLVCDGGLNFGNYGVSTLNITNGATVTVGGPITMSDSSGTVLVNFGAIGGTLTTQSVFLTNTQLSGSGTINTRGWGDDGDFVFDATHPTSFSLVRNNGGQAVRVNLDLSGAKPVGNFAVGFQGTGTLAVKDGIAIYSATGYLGDKALSNGSALVDGTGSTWTNTGALYVGYSGSGSLSISNGGTVISNGGTLGNGGTAGVVNVDGAGSAWNSSGAINIGGKIGNAINISNGGQVTSDSVSVGADAAINFGGSGGILSTNTLSALRAQITGVGTINVRGLVSDVNLLFDATHGPQQTVLWSGPGQLVTVKLDMTGIGGLGSIVVGKGMSCTLSILEGVTVKSSSGLIGIDLGKTGMVFVDGANSTWSLQTSLAVGGNGQGTLSITNGGIVTAGTITVSGFGSSSASVDGAGSSLSGVSLQVGTGSNGTLSITHGGKLSTSNTNLGISSISFIHPTGNIMVDGSGSVWNNSGNVAVGSSYGTGNLTVRNGGTVSSGKLTVYSGSLVTESVGDGSSIGVMSAFTNNGTLRLKAAPGLAAGNYAPITAGSWAGTGVVQTLGGIWDTANHMFVVAGVQAGTPGQAVTINRSVTQRVAITDGTTQNAVLIGFTSTINASNLSFIASDLTSGQNAALEGLLSPEDTILSGWTFSATGYTAGDPVALSLWVGPRFSTGTLDVWHYDGSVWTAYAPSDLSYDGTYANFTVTSFSGYAVTGTVPEPGTLAVVALGVAGLLMGRRRAGGRLTISAILGV